MAGLAAPPYPSPKLVQLGEAKALGMFNHHHTGFRHIDADFDDGRGDQNFSRPRAEVLHRFVFVLG